MASFRAAQGRNKREARAVFILDLSVYLLSYLRERTMRAKKGAPALPARAHRDAFEMGAPALGGRHDVERSLA